MMTTLLFTLAALAGTVLPPASTADWMTDEGGILELKLAHLEKARPDGGILRLDRNKRVMVWEGADSEVGCKQHVEALFADVAGASVGGEACFTVTLKKGKLKRLDLMPLPHGALLFDRYEVKGGGTGLQSSMDGAALRGHDGETLRLNGAAGAAGPSAKRKELSEAVVRDCKKAVAAIQEALAPR